MSDDPFADPDDAGTQDRSDTAAPDEEWVDVRMTDPEEGEWNVDAIVVDGRVEYVDLHVRPDLLADFVECLVADLSPERAEQVLADVVAARGLDLTAGEAAE